MRKWVQEVIVGGTHRERIWDLCRWKNVPEFGWGARLFTRPTNPEAVLMGKMQIQATTPQGRSVVWGKCLCHQAGNSRSLLSPCLVSVGDLLPRCESKSTLLLNSKMFLRTVTSHGVQPTTVNGTVRVIVGWFGSVPCSDLIVMCTRPRTTETASLGCSLHGK